MKTNIQSALEIIANMSDVDALERYEKRLDTLYKIGALSASELMRADSARIDRRNYLAQQAEAQRWHDSGNVYMYRIAKSHL